ncbi:SMAD/FHA domain-containing protein, partial [Cokeromyces recurvatus]|uniref:SMAD/FHA domain-containing protein n=1 Tax=Cokeromyces recurvatus TaxID=90255 RepID=UPI0022208D99
MSRNRSLSNTSAGSPPPALLSRGFASLRRAHRRLSNSSPSSPSASPEHSTTTNNNTLESVNTNTDSSRGAAATSENRTNRVSAESDSNMRLPRLRLVPNVGLSSRSFVFDIIDRELEPNVIYRIGRFSDRNVLSDRLSFKSKVVSRNHAELWTEQGKVYIRDIGSSSGTFLNRIRLSPPSHASAPHELRDGDTLQLGVDYQGGLEPIYRAVRIRVEINRQIQTANSPFTRAAFQQLRKMVSRLPSDLTRADIQECCICLYAIAPFQALFIAPCSHMFHFKCLRPIVFQNYPGFSCPLCRSYFDLEASVAVEVDDVLE